MTGIQRTLKEMEEAKVAPEAWVLSCIMFDNRALTGLYGHPGLLGYIEPRHFIVELKYKQIYEAMLSLNDQGIEISNVTVYAEMKRLGTADAGDVGKLMDICLLLTGPDFMADYIQQYYAFAQTLINNWKQSTEKHLAGKIATAAVDNDTAALEALQIELDAVIHYGSKDGQGLTTDNTDDLTDDLLTWCGDPQDIRGYRTGIEELDRRLGGLQENELVVLAGYTGSGKSTMVMQFALSFCDQGPGLIVPTEMSVKQWKLRMIAYLMGTDDETIRRGHVDLKAALEANDYVNRLPIAWFQGVAPTPAQILTSARNLRRNGLAEWVIVDGMHDIRAEGEVYERTNQAIDGLHEMAACGLRVIATAHLNRGATEEPNIRDLLGSSRIEQSATRILTLYRPGNLMESGEIKATPNGLSPNYAQVRLAKSRFSSAGHVVKLFFGKRNGQHAFFPAVEDKPAHVNLTAYKE